MDDATLAVMNELRDFMFERVYLEPELRRQQQRRGHRVIRDLMRLPPGPSGRDPATLSRSDAGIGRPQAADYVAGMTDRFALATHDRLFRPTLNL